MQFITRILFYTILTISFISVFPNLGHCQNDVKPENLDYVYDPQIKSVKFNSSGITISYPITNLSSNGKLILSFDLIAPEYKDYIYTITHCNFDWKPSQLTEFDYMTGINGERIENYEYSSNTIIPYVHYQLVLPNENIGWKKSGNYILKVYEDESERKLVITKRFMVVEPLYRLEAEFLKPSQSSKYQTHQEFDFTFFHKGRVIENPQIEIKANILQNGRWDNAIIGLPPLFIGDERLEFNYQNKIVFPGGKEFRHADLRSLKFRSGEVLAIEEYDDGYDVYLATEKKRAFRNYIFFQDINGSFIVENLDDLQQIIPRDEALVSTPVLTFNSEINNIRGDYAYVHFSLDSPTYLEDEDVYIFGEMTDWQLKEDYRMQYNETQHVYQLETLLKQGYYNYYYVTKKKGADGIDIEETEGNWYQTENEYIVLVYYRQFGERYDRLVAAQVFSSITN